MAWNQSTGPTKVEPKKPSALKGVVAGVVCVAIAAAVAFFVLSGKDEKPKVKVEKEPGRIKEVKPAAAEKVKAEQVKLVTNKLGQVVVKKTPKTYVDGNGILRYEGGARVARPEDFTNRVDLSKGSDGRRIRQRSKRIFKHDSENEIASLITAEPGVFIHGSKVYGERLVADFEKAMKEPIIVYETDDEHDAALKRAVNEAKLGVMEEVRAGRSICDILTEARSELDRLAEYKRFAQQEVSKYVSESATSREDAGAYLEAVNKMLTERGIAPIGQSALTKRCVRLMQKKGEQ